MLLRGVARTAVVAGTATAVSNRVSRRQGNRWAQQEAETGAPCRPHPHPPPSGCRAVPRAAEGARRPSKQQGILTEEEFADQKAKILAQ